MTLEERLAALEREVETLRAERTVQELMSRYAWMLAQGRINEIPAALFARKREDASVEYGASGRYIGFKKLSTFYEKDVRPGTLQLYTLGAPQLSMQPEEISGEWTALGVQLDAGDLGEASPTVPEERALLSSKTPEGAAYNCEWVWQRLRARFCKEDGVWKIWQLQILELLRAPYDRDFVRFATERWATDGIRLDTLFTSNIPFAPGELPENLANGPTSLHWQYTPNADAANLP